ncbi:MAG TPA: kynureninase [Gemmatimonadales bacterium]|nr:kynureninase [Gemmatimonadales bacterium]
MTSRIEYAADEGWALDQDMADPLAWCRDRFELPRDDSGRPLAYLCGNSLGLMPHAARASVAGILDDWSRRGVEGHLDAARPWYSYHEWFRGPLARVVGARPGEVVAMNSLTVNLHLMLVSFFRPTATRCKILIEESAFPSDTYAVASHLETRGLDPAEAMVIAGPRPGEALLRTEDLETVLAERGEEIALVLLPGVQYHTGQLLDLERITAAAHRAGCIAGFDLAHAAGNTELRLHDWNVDFAVWCSYKYLNGGPGAVGGCFVHEHHGKSSLPRLAGWWGNDPATRFRMHLNPSFVPVDGAEGWQLSNPPILAMAPLREALQVFEEAGMPALRAKSERLTGYLEFVIGRIPERAFELITPAEAGARGSQLSIRHPQSGAMIEHVRRHGIVGDFRPPDVIRLSPVPSYNTFHEVWRVGRALAAIAGME